MKIFSYEGIDQAKNRYRGTVKADTQKQAVVKMANQGIAVSWIEEMTSSQIAVANRLKNMKKFVDVLSGEPNPKPSPLTEPRVKSRDWMYWIFIIVAIAIIAAALAVAS